MNLEVVRRFDTRRVETEHLVRAVLAVGLCSCILGAVFLQIPDGGTSFLGSVTPGSVISQRSIVVSFAGDVFPEGVIRTQGLVIRVDVRAVVLTGSSIQGSIAPT